MKKKLLILFLFLFATAGMSFAQLGNAGGKKEKQHRKTVDAVAASLILEGYLGSLP